MDQLIQTIRPPGSLEEDQITSPEAGFTMSVRVGQTKLIKKNGGAGFRIGVRSDINEYRSNCFAKGGIDIGITPSHLVIGKKKKDVWLCGSLCGGQEQRSTKDGAGQAGRGKIHGQF